MMRGPIPEDQRVARITPDNPVTRGFYKEKMREVCFVGDMVIFYVGPSTKSSIMSAVMRARKDLAHDEEMWFYIFFDKKKNAVCCKKTK